MSSHWVEFDEADTAARQAHARRIAAVSDLLATSAHVSLVSMISSRCQVSAKTAHAWVREASELRELPDLAEASGRGELSGDQVAALRVLAEPGSDGAWVETLASPIGSQDFRINDLQRMARRETARALEREDGGRYLKMAPTPDERFVRGRFQLHPEEAAVLEHQLDARVPAGTALGGLPVAHADALVALATGVAGASAGGNGGRVKATVVVRSDPRVLEGESDAPGELANDTFVSASVVRRLAEEGRVMTLEAPVADPQTDDIPAPVRRWVYHRDRGRCRGVVCITPTLDLEMHHMLPRNQGGTHDPPNLILLCVICHQIKIHRHGWRVVGDAEHTVSWIRPDGTTHKPPPIVKRARPPNIN